MNNEEAKAYWENVSRVDPTVKLEPVQETRDRQAYLLGQGQSPQVVIVISSVWLLLLMLALSGLVLVMALDLYPIPTSKYDVDGSIEAVVRWSQAVDNRLDRLESPAQ